VSTPQRSLSALVLGIALLLATACGGPHEGAVHRGKAPSVVTSGTLEGKHYNLVVVESGDGLCMELNFQDSRSNSGFCPGTRTEAPRPPDFGMDGPSPSLDADVAYGLGPTAAVTVQLREVGDGGRFVGTPVVYPVHPLPGWVGHGTWWGPFLQPSGSAQLVETFRDEAGHPVPVESFLR
jgi:hypothetical protein